MGGSIRRSIRAVLPGTSKKEKPGKSEKYDDGSFSNDYEEEEVCQSSKISFRSLLGGSKAGKKKSQKSQSRESAEYYDGNEDESSWSEDMGEDSAHEYDDFGFNDSNMSSISELDIGDQNQVLLVLCKELELDT